MRAPLEPALAFGQRVTVFIPKRSSLGAVCDQEGFDRRRRATVVDPMDGRRPLVRFSGGLGQLEIPRAWVRP